MRRKEGALVPLEIAIIEASAELRRAGQPEVHGYELAKVVRDLRNARRLTAYGTLYKALTRLEREGYLASRWEDPQTAADGGRPRRRFYRLTLEGETALNEELAKAREHANQRPAAAVVR
jgi:DNA-binding PadR family transcriptional regulator